MSMTLLRPRGHLDARHDVERTDRRQNRSAEQSAMTSFRISRALGDESLRAMKVLLDLTATHARDVLRYVPGSSRNPQVHAIDDLSTTYISSSMMYKQLGKHHRDLTDVADAIEEAMQDVDVIPLFINQLKLSRDGSRKVLGMFDRATVRAMQRDASAVQRLARNERLDITIPVPDHITFLTLPDGMSARYPYGTDRKAVGEVVLDTVRDQLSLPLRDLQLGKLSCGVRGKEITQ